MRTRVQSLALLSGLRIWHCCEPWCRSQGQLRSCVAVAMAWTGICISDLVPSLETSKCHGCGPKKQTKQNKTKQKKTNNKNTLTELPCVSGSLHLDGDKHGVRVCWCYHGLLLGLHEMMKAKHWAHGRCLLNPCPLP